MTKDVVRVVVEVPADFCPIAADECGTVEAWAQATIDSEIAVYKEADAIMVVYAQEVARGRSLI